MLILISYQGYTIKTVIICHFTLREMGIITVVVQSLSCVQLFVTPWTAAQQASLFLTISQSLLKFMSIDLVRLSNHLILCRPLFHLSSIFPTIRVFSKESTLCIKRSKYWSFSINLSSECSGLISFVSYFSNKMINILRVGAVQLLCFFLKFLAQALRCIHVQISVMLA